MNFRPIGTIRTPFAEPSQAPITTTYSRGARGRVEVLPQFVEGLKDLAGFERIWLIWHAHRCGEAPLIVQPPFATPPKGVFATRSQSRPNALGLSCVRLLAVEAGVLHVADVDMLDGTPLLDIKPYSRWSDCFPDARCGWFEDADADQPGR